MDPALSAARALFTRAKAKKKEGGKLGVPRGAASSIEGGSRLDADMVYVPDLIVKRLCAPM